MAVSDYSTTPGNNTSISGINIAEGCPPGNINDAIRQVMADVKADADTQDGKLGPATDSSAGIVKTGTNVDVTSDGTISVKDATTSAKGLVQLSSATDSTDEDKAATPTAVKAAYALAAAALPKAGGEITGDIFGYRPCLRGSGASSRVYLQGSDSTNTCGWIIACGITDPYNLDKLYSELQNQMVLGQVHI